MPSLFVRLSASLSFFFFPMAILLLPLAILMTWGMEYSNLYETLMFSFSLLGTFVIAHILAFLTINFKQKMIAKQPTKKKTAMRLNLLIIFVNLALLSSTLTYMHFVPLEPTIFYYITLALIHLLFTIPAEFIAKKMENWKKVYIWGIFSSPLVMWILLTMFYLSETI